MGRVSISHLEERIVVEERERDEENRKRWMKKKEMEQTEGWRKQKEME